MSQSNLYIDIMSLSDLEKIKDVLENDFDDFWNYNIFKSELNNPNSSYFVVKDNDLIVGFSGILIVLDEADITNIVVKKDHRGKGISNLLLEKIIDFCIEKQINKINLEVNSANTVAINLYKKFGFKEVGLRKNYYKDNDGLLFTKNLKD